MESSHEGTDGRYSRTDERTILMIEAGEIKHVSVEALWGGNGQTILAFTGLALVTKTIFQ